jgi:GAF domain-containing protein
MYKTFAAAAITAVTVALLSIQFASMFVDGGVLPNVAPLGACDLVIGPVSGATSELHPGDVVHVPSLDPAARLFLASSSARVGSVFRIPVMRAGGLLVANVAMPSGLSWRFWLAGVFAKLIIYGLGLLVLWQGRDRAAMFFGVASLAISVAIYPAPGSALPPALQPAYAAIAPCFAEIAAMSLYLMVEWLANPFLSRAWILATRAVVVVGLALAFADSILGPTGRISTGCVNSFLAAAHPPGYMAALIVTLIALTVAYFRAAGETRQRLRWIYVSTFIGFSGVLAYLGGQLLGRPIPAYPIIDLTAIAIPLGYAYAILRHRVIDVGFVLNRAIVFAAMTTVVVVIFALLADFVERTAVAPNASVALQVVIALVLALSFNALQKRVEWGIDQVFFRNKHRAEAAIRQLCDEAPFVHSADILHGRVVGALRRELGARAVSLYYAQGDRYELVESDGGEFPPRVHVDDPAFVRLRTYLRDVNLTDVDSVLGPSGIVFPLAVRGRLTGALVCTTRASQEPYDPDERAIVRTLAISVATSLEAIRARDHAQLVCAIAQGTIDIDHARIRATELCVDD